MKKYFLSIVALAGMLFATSCQESLVEPQVDGTTTFTVQVPGQMGTKATPYNGNVNKLYVQVYPENVSETLLFQPEVVEIVDGFFTVSISLIQDQRYDIIFWAQEDESYVKKGDDLRVVSMKNHHNSETGAAFFAYLNDFVPTGTSQPVTLKRPFAQLNLGTTEASLNPNSGRVFLSQSKVKVSNVAAEFNTVTGMGQEPVVYETILLDVPQSTITVNNVPYIYISMDYLPIVGDDQALVTVAADIELENEQVISHEFTNVPVRENYRTNIVGNLISSTTDFKVEIDDKFEEDYSDTDDIISNDYYVVDNVDQAESKFAAGETHVAINYIVDGGDIDIPSTAAETLYLQLPDVNAEFTVNVPQQVKKLNIAVPNTNESNVGLNLIVNAPYSTVDFTGQAAMITSTTAPNTLNLNGAEVGTIIVMQGNVVIENESQVDVLDNQSNEVVTVYVDNTSNVVVPENDNFNKVAEPAVVETLADLQTILKYSASDVIELSNAITNTIDFILDLKGKTVTAVDNATGSYGLITNKANLTIVGPGTISLSATNDRDWNAYSSVISNNPGGNLVVEGGVVIEHLGGTDMAYGIDNLTNGKGTSAITTIKGATVKSTYRAIRQFLNGIEATNELYVKAGSTILNTTGTNKGIWMQDPSAEANTGKLVVEEGAHVDDVYLSVTAGSTEWPVEVSIASSSLNQGKTVMSSNVPEGYEVVEVGGVWKVIKSELWKLVSTADELSEALNANKSVIFANDIVLTADTWTPIGTADHPYSGVIDGNGKKISGLKVEDVEYAAFISHTAPNTIIKNLTLENVNLNSKKHAAGVVCVAGENLTLENITVSGTIIAASYAGGIVHNAANVIIKNCINNANVTANRAGGIASWVTVGANIENVENNGHITGGVGAAGIAHGFAGSIKNAKNYGNIISNNLEAAAGIAGVQKGASTYEYCYNYGEVKSTFDDPNASAAGILGQSAGSSSILNYCANYGDVTAEKSYAAGIAYSLYGSINANYCYNEGNISGADGAGAIAPKAQYGTGDTANRCLNSGIITSENGVVYQGSNNNNSCYYYNATKLYDVKNNSLVSSQDVINVLNGGTDNEFFSLDNNGIIVVVAE